MRRHRYEVVVVGAGPAGSFAAGRLAQLGHDVALVDKNIIPRCGIVCTGIVGREAYERLDLPEGSVVDTIHRARFCSPSGVEVTYKPRNPLAYVVDRTCFDGTLAARAAEAGATLLRGWTALGVEKSRGGVTVTIMNGATHVLRARALVVATGYHVRLHRAAGLGRTPGYVNGVHADLPFADLDGAELYFGNGIAPGFFAWVVPYGPGMARLGVLAPRGGQALFRKFLRLEPIRSRLRVGIHNGGEDLIHSRISSRAIAQGFTRPAYSDRVLAVGEAAGQVKTTTSGGIYYGMIGAEIAAEILSGGLRRNRLSAGYLARYESAWESRLGGEIETGLELQRIARTMSDPEIDALFVALQNGLASSVRHLIRFDWHRLAISVLLKRSKAWRLGTGAVSALGLG